MALFLNLVSQPFGAWGAHSNKAEINSSNLEELHKEFRTCEENSVFLREEQRQRESKILTLNQGIKLLIYSVNEKTTDAIMYEKKIVYEKKNYFKFKL